MPLFRKKPVTVEANQWFNDKDHPKVKPLIKLGNCLYCHNDYYKHGWINTLEGGHIVCPGDWVITGVNGEFYPCKPDIFEKTYEPA